MKSKREQIRELLSKCTEDQIDFFNRLYNSVDDVPKNRLNSVLNQVIRTIQRNNIDSIKNLLHLNKK